MLRESIENQKIFQNKILLLEKALESKENRINELEIFNSKYEQENLLIKSEKEKVYFELEKIQTELFDEKMKSNIKLKEKENVK